MDGTKKELLIVNSILHGNKKLKMEPKTFVLLFISLKKMLLSFKVGSVRSYIK